MRISRRNWLIGVVATFTLGACSPAAPAPPTTGPGIAKPVAGPKGKAVFAADGSTVLAKADPGLSYLPGLLQTLWQIYDGLTWMGRDGKAVPGLARSWKTVDEKTWEFTLGDWRFHNGRGVTADDVVQTFERYLDPANKLLVKGVLGTVEKVTRVDDKTVRITTNVPDPILPKSIGLSMIMPMKEFKEQGDKFFDNPIGTGPYKIVSVDYKNALVYAAMDPDFASPRGAPNVKDLEIRFVPEEASRIAALRTGEVDMIGSLSYDTAAPLWQQGFKPIRSDAEAAWSWVLNTFDGPMKDKRVRQAINYAVNKKAISEAVFGEGVTLDGQLLGPAVHGYDPELRPYPYDPAKAKQLLAEAGYPNGFETVITSQNILGSRVYTQAVVGDLQTVGVRARIVLNEPSVNREQQLGPPNKRSDLFSFIGPWAATFEASQSWNELTSNFKVENGRKWVNEEFDRLYQQAKATFDDNKRAELYRRAGAILHEEAPLLFLWVHRRLGATKKEVTWEAGQFADEFVSKLKKE